MANITNETKSSKHDLIDNFCTQNEVEDMHLRMYLHEKGYVTLTEKEYSKLEEQE